MINQLAQHNIIIGDKPGCAENMEYLININYCLWRIHEAPCLNSTILPANWQWDVDDLYFYTHDLTADTYTFTITDNATPEPNIVTGTFVIELDNSHFSFPDTYFEVTEDRSLPDDVYIDNFYTFEKGIHIYNGATLTINNSEYEFGPDASIIIEPGTKLIVNNTILTNSKYCAPDFAFWGGIEVWGNNSTHQWPDANGQLQQAYLMLQNNATIENAITAISLWKPNDWSTTGGIVIANDAFLRNNAKAVHALRYENYHPYNPAELMDYRGVFNNCIFEVDANYLGHEIFYKHIDLNQVKGLRFSGCDFKLSPAAIGVSDYNQAIATYNAGFRVDAPCTTITTPCGSYDNGSFEGFYKAINASNAGSTNTFSVEKAVFNNNTTGIYANGVNNLSVLFSEFQIGKNTADLESCESKGKLASGFGIDLNHCSGFAIEENYFTKATDAPTGIYTGIRCKDSETRYDIIYKNTFEGLNCGNFAEGKNRDNVLFDDRGLEYRCNLNANNNVDFMVTTDDPYYNPAMINGFQGYTNISAGNTFSQQSGVQWHFRNEGTQQIDYWWYTGSPVEEPEYYCDPLPSPCFFIPNPISIENPCPSHYGGGSGTEKELALTTEQFQESELAYFDAFNDYSNVKSMYDNLEDGGNTQILKSEVENAFPSDMWQLRSELLGVSPHVSKEVLMTASEKTEIFPESVLFEILSANPDELKDGDMLNFLETKEEPLPAYMIDMLRQLAGGITYKTVLKRQMADFHAKKSLAAHDIIRSILADSVFDAQLYRNWLDNIGGVNADKQIIASYIEEGNYASASSLLNLIPTLYELSGQSLNEYNDYKSFTEFQISLKQQNKDIFELDSMEVDYLVDLADNSSGTAKTGARGILEYAYGYHYCDCLSGDSSGLKSTVIAFDKAEQDNGLSIEAKPNPADDWVAFNYIIPSYIDEAVLIITDIEGREIVKFRIDTERGQQLWDARKVKSGIYLYTLEAGINIKSGKLIIK